MTGVLIVVTTRGDDPCRLDALCTEIERQVGASREKHRLVVITNGSVDKSSGILSRIEVTNVNLPGVVGVRNAALEERRADEALLFVDDDQYPRPAWLTGMLEAMTRYPDSIISGAVRYVATTPEGIRLIEDGYVSQDHDLGERPLATTGTGNTLIPAGLLAKNSDLRFDARFARSGGEDTAFFSAMSPAPASIIAAPAGLVDETLDATKQTKNHWHRKFRTSGFSRALLLRDEGVGNLQLIYKAALRLTFTCVKIAFCRLRGKHASALDAYRIYSALGFIDAVRGVSQDLYSTPDQG